MMETKKIRQESIFEAQAGLFKLLSHPARLKILALLREGEECVCHMEAMLGYRQAYLSQQLALLRESGVLEMRREGWNVYYRVARPEIYRILDAAYTVGGSLDELRLWEEKKKSCECPKCCRARGETPAGEDTPLALTE
ncbi:MULTISPECIES: helix-turn-helix transcriptional regulator [Anaerolinea]|uniref:ArsR/SmtB family transcription factor n=1 Tax=Anaerolinea TaxID=233189 RepID=UPI00263605B3|nr:metalloregulator ArsR/SmtB family transcription factor [Anaerolinea thermophila]